MEAKFAVADAATLETFLARETLGDCRLGPVRTVKLGDTYFDTADRALLRRGLSLRGRVTDVTTTWRSPDTSASRSSGSPTLP